MGIDQSYKITRMGDVSLKLTSSVERILIDVKHFPALKETWFS